MVQEEIIIRAQEPDDIPAITEALNQPQAIWGTLQVPFVSIAERQKRHEAGTPTTLLVAEVEGRVVGNAGLMRFENRRVHAATLGMAIHDAFAGRGCGSALLSALLEQADRWLNISRVELTVWDDNRGAIALYERSGFQREGLCRSYAWRDGAYADALMMARLRQDD